MVTIIILALLIYGIFQFTKYLMGATVNHAQSHIAGSWGWQNLNPEPGEDLITFTKSVTAFVLALLLFRSSFRNPVIPTPLWRGKALRFAERVFVARFGSRIGDVDRVGRLGNREAACFGCVELA